MVKRSFFGGARPEQDGETAPMAPATTTRETGALDSGIGPDLGGVSFEQGLHRVQELLERVEDMPSIPASAAQVIHLAADPDASAKDVADAVSMDPALTTRVLRIVNSVAYGMPRRVSTVSHAVVIMGMSALRSAVISASVASELSISAEKSGLDPNAFWRHCAGAAAGGRILSKHFKLGSAGEMFVAGLLHDMGRLVLARALSLQHRRVMRRMEAEKTDIITAEIDEFGCSHCHAGWWLADQWNLPTELQHAAGHHHNPLVAGEGASFAAIIQLADLMSQSLEHDQDDDAGSPEAGGSPDIADLPLQDATWDALLAMKRDFDRSELPVLLQRLTAELDGCMSFARGLME